MRGVRLARIGFPDINQIMRLRQVLPPWAQWERHGCHPAYGDEFLSTVVAGGLELDLASFSHSLGRIQNLFL